MNPQPNRVTAAELSRITGYSPSTISRLQTAEVLQRDSDRLFDLPNSIRRILQHEEVRQHPGKHPDGDTVPATPEGEFHWRLRKMLLSVMEIYVATATLCKQHKELWQFLTASEAFVRSVPADTGQLVGQAGKGVNKLRDTVLPMLKTWEKLDKRLVLGGPFTGV